MNPGNAWIWAMGHRIFFSLDQRRTVKKCPPVAFFNQRLLGFETGHAWVGVNIRSLAKPGRHNEPW